MDIIDTHCHLDVDNFALDRSLILNAARLAGVAGIIVPGIYADSWQNLLQVCATATDLYPALGLHPLYLRKHDLQQLHWLWQLTVDKSLVAIGEIGLDYWDKNLDREAQQKFFEEQLVIAASAKLPVLLHVRKAHDQVLATLKRIRVVGGIAHAFNGSLVQAHNYLDLGFKLGFGGMLTFARSRKLHDLAKNLPADALVLETDAPDLTVASHQGERNSPAYLPECLLALAQTRNEDLSFVADYTTRNAREVLRLHE